MTTRTLALIGLLCIGTAASVCTAPVEARTFVDVDINLAPPAPRYEQVVVRPGYVWAPGYWRWYGGRHVWVAGYYIRERPGFVWVPHHWVQGPRGGWHFVEGHWAPRVDGPGVGFINVAPPAPVYERVVVRPGYVWTPGYYRWDPAVGRYVWVRGTYVLERAGYVWVPHRWVQGPNGGWHLQEGYWARR